MDKAVKITAIEEAKELMRELIAIQTKLVGLQKQTSDLISNIPLIELIKGEKKKNEDRGVNKVAEDERDVWAQTGRCINCSISIVGEFVNNRSTKNVLLCKDCEEREDPKTAKVSEEHSYTYKSKHQI